MALSSGSRRPVLCLAGPVGAQFQGVSPVVLAPGEDVHLAAPVARYLDGDVRRSAKAVQPQPAARLDLAQPQRPVADHAGAQERGCLLIGKAVGDRVDEIGRGDHHLGKAAVGVLPGEAGVRAQVLLATTAVIAPAAGPMEPRHAHPLVQLDLGYALAHGIDRADDLVPRHDRQAGQRYLALGQVQVGVAHPAGQHPQPHLARSGLGHRQVGRLQWVLLGGPGRPQDHRPHV